MTSMRKTGMQRRFTSALEYFGLVHPSGPGAPLPGAPRKSRYGIPTSPRLDQDIDSLERRVAELEARLGESDSR
ncbi:MAG: hypothetical protein Q7T55_02680 [Solirubrobacteraceae bacterium]|nr:hypothetical protein [Solirubrobacteraceae bacterium]